MDKLILKNKNKRGFSTIELMIAMAILVLTLTAVIVTSFGTQSFLIGSQTNAEAIKKAQELLEKEQALARKDFNLVNSRGEIIDDIYKKSVTVKPQLEVDPYFSTKEITAKVKWTNERQIEQEVSLTTLLSNFDASIGGNTCYSDLSDSDLLDDSVNTAEDWNSPEIASTTDLSAFPGIPAGTYTLSDVDAYRGKLYATASRTTSPTDPTFFVFDIRDDGTLTYEGSTDTTGPTVSSTGPNAVTVAKNYAYVANGYTGANFSTCTVGVNCSQLQAVKLSDLSIVNYKLPSITSTSGGIGNSIFYRNGYIYLGLTSTGNSQPEFNIVDVHPLLLPIPGNPLNLGSGIDVGNDINALLVRNSYAYVASPNTQELQIANINDPLTPLLSGNFNSGTGAGHGKGMYLVGDKFYLGKTTGGGFDFHILDNSTPASSLTELGGLDVGGSVNEVIVRDYLSFVLTNDTLQVYRTDNPASVTSLTTFPLPTSGSTTEPSMDCEGNNLYISSNDSGGRGKIYVIKPGT